MKLSKCEKEILNCFKETLIPSFIKIENIKGLDLMLCYEELRNQIYNLENGYRIDTKNDSWNEDKNFIFDGKYEKVLLNIVSTSNDIKLKFHCLLSLLVLQIFQDHINKDLP